MQISIVTPAAKGTNTGNRVTALRMAALLRHLGHRVLVRADWGADGSEVLIALHARKSAGALMKSRAAAPDQARVLVLTGTDVYGDIDADMSVKRSLELVDRVVVLQPKALERLPAGVRSKTHVILQSARAPSTRVESDPDHFDVCVLAHMRPVKDPLLAARAARLLPESSRLRVRHVGGALDEASRAEAQAEAQHNPRYEWLGNLRRAKALEVLAGSKLLVLSSHNEGGPAVVTEAIACGVPVLSTRIPAAEALLGADHPGLFPIGDVDALASLLSRCEQNEGFLAELKGRSVDLLPSVDPCREAEDLRRLLAELPIPNPRVESPPVQAPE